MPSYTFVIKKENIVVEFTTDNKKFIEEEFEKWVNSISVKKKNEKPLKSIKKQPSKILPENVEEEASKALEEKVESSSKKTGISQEVINEGDLLVQETPSAFQKLSRKLSSEVFDEQIKDEQVGLDEKKQQDDVIENEDNFVDIEHLKKEVIEVAISKEVEDDIEIEFESPSIDGDDLIELEEVDFSDSEFDEIFQEKINSDVNEYKPNENKKFAEFEKGKECKDAVEKLILVAKYLLEIEHKDRFVMKDIMDLAAENSIKEIDYALITKAVSLGFVKVVPDLTGIADVVEYALTPKGEDYFNG